MLIGLIIALLALSDDNAPTLNLVINCASAIISQKGHSVVTVFIVNKSDKKLSIDGVGQIELSGSSGTYWAPFVIKTGKPAEENEVAPAIYVKPTSSKQYKVDMSTLKWERFLSSTWPDKTLNEYVFKGHYNLKWVVGGATSNEVLVEVK